VCRFNRKYRIDRGEGANGLEDEIRQYLNLTPARWQSTEKVKGVIEEIRKFGFSKSEVLQILNLMPQSVVELYLIIERIEENLDEEKILELLGIIKKFL